MKWQARHTVWHLWSRRKVEELYTNLLPRPAGPGSRFQVSWKRSRWLSAVCPCGPSVRLWACWAVMSQTHCNHEVEWCHLHSRWLQVWGWSRLSSDTATLNPPQRKRRRPGGWLVYLKKTNGWIFTLCLLLHHVLSHSTYRTVCMELQAEKPVTSGFRRLYELWKDGR